MFASVLTLSLSRIVIAMQVMAVGVSTPGGYAVKNWRSIAMFLGPITLAMYVISSVCIKAVLQGLSWPEAMIIGACITPTDPVLANSVIKGKFANRYIPTHLRNLLAMESGANDGLGLPFLMLPLLLMSRASQSVALTEWAIHTWLYEILFSILVGGVFGIGARFMLRQSEKRNLIDKDSFLVFTIALTLVVTGVSAMLHTDDLLACFICGNAFAWDAKFLLATHDSDIVEVIDMLFNITYFVFFGSLIPWQAFPKFGIWRLTLMSGLILLFRRLPVVMLLRPWLPVLQSRKQAFFAGWFGPMGVGAIFFSLITKDFVTTHASRIVVQTSIGEDCFPLVCWVVLSSILIHGITVPITNFHMKKRAKLKNKRTLKIREQLQAIAGETIHEKDLAEALNLPQTLKVAPSDVNGSDEPFITPDTEDLDEWEYYTDYEDVDEEEIEGLEEGEYIRTPGVPEQITVIIDGVESVQETVRPGVKKKVRRRRAIQTASQSPTQSTATSFSELQESDNNQDTVMSTDIPFHLRPSQHQ